MNVETMQMDPRVANIYYRDYLKKVSEHREERKKALSAEDAEALALLEREDEELKRAYRAMARGQRILNLPEVLRAAGVDTQFAPRLAVARASWKECFFGARSDVATFSPSRWEWGRLSKGALRFAAAIFPDQCRHKPTLRAIVPSIPAYLRPAGDLRDYHLLWEAVWQPAPPVDPILLKKVGTATYAVLAQWDLTPLERSILAGRRTEGGRS